MAFLNRTVWTDAAYIARRYHRLSASHIHTFTRSTPIKTIADSIASDGTCIISPFYTPAQVASFNSEVVPHLRTLSFEQPGPSKFDTSENDQTFQAFNGSNSRRLSNLFGKSATFSKVFLEDDVLHNTCKAIISRDRSNAQGSYWLSVAQLICLSPGAEGQMPHTDGAQWWPFFDMPDRKRANTMLLNFLVAMTDTTVENGATRVVPGSHLTDYAIEDGLATDVGVSDTNEQLPKAWNSDHAVPIPLKAGDCLLVGGGIVHFGGQNASTDEERRVLSIAVVDSAFTPEEANPLLVGEKVAETMSDRVRRFVGLSKEPMLPDGSLGVWYPRS